MKRKLNRHHIFPKSRGRKRRNNIVKIDENWHKSWHYCFGNLTIDEVHRMIDIIMLVKPSGTWTSKMLHDLRNAIIKDDYERVWSLISQANKSQVSM